MSQMLQVSSKKDFPGSNVLKIRTRKFGEVDIDKNKILTMPDGLPGFEKYSRFVLLEDANAKPFWWFQSVEEPDLALVVMDPFIFKPDYKPDLKSIITLKNWRNLKEEDLAVFVVINISQTTGEKTITANLIGPIVVNMKQNEAIQVVFQDSTYSHKHNILVS